MIKTLNNRNVLDFKTFSMLETEERAQGAVDDQDALVVKGIIDRLLFDNMVGLFLATGKRKSTFKGKEQGDDEDTDKYYTTTEGTVADDKLYALNGIPVGEFNPEKTVITKIQMSNMVEPYDTGSAANAARKSEKEREKRSASSHKGLEWVRENMPELNNKIAELGAKLDAVERQTAGKTDQTSKNALDAAKANFKAKMELAIILSNGGSEYLKDEHRRLMTANANSNVTYDIIDSIREEYLKEHEPELYDEYERLRDMLEETRTAGEDRLIEMYSEILGVSQDKAKTMVTAGTGLKKSAKETPEQSARKEIRTKLNDSIEGKLYMAEIAMGIGGDLSPEQQRQIEEQAVAAMKEKDRQRRITDEDIRKEVMDIPGVNPDKYAETSLDANASYEKALEKVSAMSEDKFIQRYALAVVNKETGDESGDKWEKSGTALKMSNAAEDVLNSLKYKESSPTITSVGTDEKTGKMSVSSPKAELSPDEKIKKRAEYNSKLADMLVSTRGEYKSKSEAMDAVSKMSDDEFAKKYAIVSTETAQAAPVSKENEKAAAQDDESTITRSSAVNKKEEEIASELKYKHGGAPAAAKAGEAPKYAPGIDPMTGRSDKGHKPVELTPAEKQAKRDQLNSELAKIYANKAEFAVYKYDVSDEAMARDMEQALGMPYSDALNDVKTNRKAAIQKMKDNGAPEEIVDELAYAKNISPDDAKKEYMTNPSKAVDELVRIRVATAGFEPKKVGQVYFRARSADTYNAAKLIVQVPYVVLTNDKNELGERVAKQMVAKESYSGFSKRPFEYDTETGVITLSEPIVLPANSKVGVDGEGGPRPVRYAINKYLQVDPEEKPFLPDRIVGDTTMKDIIVYQPETGMPDYVTAIVSKGEWQMMEKGEIVSNAAIGKSASYLSDAADVEGANVSGYGEVLAGLSELSPENFARKYADTYKDDYDIVLSIITGEGEENDEDYQAKLADLTAKYEGEDNEGAAAKAQATLKKEPDRERRKMAEKLARDLSGRPDKFHVILESYDKSGEKSDMSEPVKTVNYWIRFKVIIGDMAEYQKNRAQGISSETYGESRKTEKLSGHYRMIYDKIKDMPNDELIQLYAKQTGATEDDASEKLRTDRNKFIDDLAWSIYDADIVDMYATAFSTQAREITPEEARDALKKNRLEAITRLNRKIKIAKETGGEAVPEEVGVDTITKRKIINIPYGVSSKTIDAWRSARKAEGVSSFATGKDVKKHFLGKEEVSGTYARGEDELIDAYVREMGVSEKVAKRLLYSGTTGTDDSIAKAYAKRYGIDIDAALEQVADDKEDVVSKIVDKNRVSMVDTIAASYDAEAAKRKFEVDPRKKYAKKTNDKTRLRKAYYQYKHSEIEGMDDEAAIDAYVELTGEDAYDVAALLDKEESKKSEDAPKYIGREELNKRYAETAADEASVGSMTGELAAANYDVYEVSDEDMARDASDMFGLNYADALESIRKNRGAMINKMEKRYRGEKESAEEAEQLGHKIEGTVSTRQKYYEEQQLRRGKQEASKTLSALRRDLESMSDEELRRGYEYMFDENIKKIEAEVREKFEQLFDGPAEMPQDRNELIDAIVNNEEDMLTLKFAKTEQSEKYYAKLSAEYAIDKKLYPYVAYMNGLSNDMLHKFAREELANSMAAREELGLEEGDTPKDNEDIIAYLKAAKRQQIARNPYMKMNIG